MQKITFLFSLFSLSLSFSQQLMINEVSQGSGFLEYVELVVVGNPICEGEPIPTIDLQRVIIDDNNGFFASGTGTGIAAGALRFAPIPFWENIPQGTYIVIYNLDDGVRNSALPPDDLSLTDGNCTLIIPGNSLLLESPITDPITPNSGNPLYPTADADWGSGTGWDGVSMNNTNDSFQIPNLGVNGTPLHSISWGNNTSDPIIYFPGPVGSQVISFKNIISNDYNEQQNWVIEAIASGQTPGLPNSLENDTWIGTMNPTCRVNPSLSFIIQDASCSGNDGTISVIVNGPTNFSILWDNGETTPSIDNLAPGTYTVEVRDSTTGCVYTASAIVAQDNGNLAIATTVTDESCTNVCDGTVQYTISGGQTPYTTTWTQNGNTITEPTNFCAGDYTIHVQDANTCETEVNISVITGITIPYAISNDTTICAGDSINLFMQNLSLIGLPPTHLWSTGETTSEINVKPNTTTSYTVIYSKDGCVINENVEVFVEVCEFGIDFPNIFTPNADDSNDFFIPITFKGTINVEFIILNRWGNLMYQTNEQIIKWDGKSQDGKDASPGTYFYKLIYKDETQEEKLMHGFLYLIR